MADITRRTALKSAAALCGAAALGAAGSTPPNVLILLTDDQGYGDLSCHGNPILRTPNLDRLHGESVRFTQFHVAPMCSPTRGQLMSGMDCVRNGAMATACGRSQLREGLPTIADAFASGGYQTGIFGKWHLGYSYPFRPMDRGFREANYFLGYGITGAGDFWNNDYFNPRYYHNTEPRHARGYCNDLWFDLAMRWMDQCRSRRQPFFAYLPTNIPHFPEWVASNYRAVYDGRGPAPYYGMVANLDENVARLEAFLRKSGLRDNTILIYMSDNGGVTGVKYYNAGMRGGKCSLYDGGHRVPCFVRWPAGNFAHGRDIGTQAQVQDIYPTLLDLCGVPKPANAALDGASLAGVLHGKPLADRMFVVQYYQNNIRKDHSAVIWNDWRLVETKELYNIRSDPGQQNNVAAAHPDIVARMREHYERWWAGVEPRLNDLVPTHVGSTHQNPAMMCSSEWVDVRADGQASARMAQGGGRGGPWDILVERGGRYTVELGRWPKDADLPLRAGAPEFKATEETVPAGKALPIASAQLTVAGQSLQSPVGQEDRVATFETTLQPGRTKLHGWFRDRAGQDLCGAYFAYVTWKG
jgi:arylsulfatase